jgi:hypothetical protein
MWEQRWNALAYLVQWRRMIYMDSHLQVVHDPREKSISLLTRKAVTYHNLNIVLNVNSKMIMISMILLMHTQVH